MHALTRPPDDHSSSPLGDRTCVKHVNRGGDGRITERGPRLSSSFILGCKRAVCSKQEHEHPNDACDSRPRERLSRNASILSGKLLAPATIPLIEHGLKQSHL